MISVSMCVRNAREALDNPLRQTRYFVKSGHSLVYTAEGEEDIEHPPDFFGFRVSFQVGHDTYAADFGADTKIGEETPEAGMAAPAVAIREVHWAEPKRISGSGPMAVAGIHLFVVRFCNGTFSITCQLSNGTVSKDGSGFCGELAVSNLSFWYQDELKHQELDGPTYLGARGIYVSRLWLSDEDDIGVEAKAPKQLSFYGPGNLPVYSDPFPEQDPPDTYGHPIYYGEPNGAAPGGADLYPVNVVVSWQAAQKAVARQRIACYDRETGTRLSFNTELRLTRGIQPSKITEIPCFVRPLGQYDDAREYINHNGQTAYGYATARSYTPFDGQHLIRAYTWLEPLIMLYGDQWAIHTMKSLAAEARTSWNPNRKPKSYGWRPFTLGNLLEDSPRGQGSPNCGREYGWVAALAAWALSLTKRSQDKEYRMWLDWCSKLLAFAQQVVPPHGIPLRVDKDWASGGQTSFWSTYKVPNNKGVAQAIEIPIVYWGVYCLQKQLGIFPMDNAMIRGCLAVYVDMEPVNDPWSGTTKGPPLCVVVSEDGEPVNKVTEGFGPGEPVNGYWALPCAIEAAAKNESTSSAKKALLRGLKRYNRPAKTWKEKDGMLFYSGKINSFYHAWTVAYNKGRKEN